MAEGTIVINSRKAAIINLPAYLRDKYQLTRGRKVDITDDGKSIIITPKDN